MENKSVSVVIAKFVILQLLPFFYRNTFAAETGFQNYQQNLLSEFPHSFLMYQHLAFMTKFSFSLNVTIKKYSSPNFTHYSHEPYIPLTPVRKMSLHTLMCTCHSKSNFILSNIQKYWSTLYNAKQNGKCSHQIMFLNQKNNVINHMQQTSQINIQEY